MGPQMSTVALLHGQGSLRAIVLRLALVTSRIAYLQVAQHWGLTQPCTELVTRV